MQNDYIAYLNSPIGRIKLTGDETSIKSVLFVFDDAEMEEEKLNSVLTDCKSQLSEYFTGKRKEFTILIKQEGTEFQQKVWNELVKIPYGKTVSYNSIAGFLGDKKSIRAVGSANGRNQISIIVPCHRVIGSNGALTGYAGGLWRKKWLLSHEREHFKGEKQMELF